MKVEWKNVKGFEGKYQVSNTGDVRSLDYKMTGQTKILTQAIDADGYHYVNLCKDGQQKIYKVHRLVAEAFIKKTSSKKSEVGHIDGNTHNNEVSNLSWVTHKENCSEKLFIEHQRKSSPKRMEVCQYDLNGNLVATYLSLRDAERTTNIDRKKIQVNCTTHPEYAVGGYKWKYKVND